MKSNIRKIVVGESYSHNIKYLKGAEYQVGKIRCTITDFVLNDDGGIEIYVTDGKSRFIWKEINEKPLEVEYDVNFS